MVRFDSYRAASAGNRAGRNLVTKSTLGGRATWQAVTRGKFEQASRSDHGGADPAQERGRPSGWGEAGAGARHENNHYAPIRTTGVVSTAWEEGNLRQWGRPGMVGESRASNGILRMTDQLGVGGSEVPAKPDNAGGG